MDLSIILGFMAISLAIFAIGLPNVSQSNLSWMFRGKQPHTNEDIAVIKRFLGIMGTLGYFGFLITLGFLIGNLAESPANTIVVSLKLESWLKPVIQIICGLFGVGIVWFIIHRVWNIALDSVKRNPPMQSDTEKPKPHDNNIGTTVNFDFKLDTTSIAKMKSEQLKVLKQIIDKLQSEKPKVK